MILWVWATNVFLVVNQGRRVMVGGSGEVITGDAFDVSMWKGRAKAGYENLGWVGAGGLLEKFNDLVVGFEGGVAVDMATGSGAVARQLAPHFERVRAFDVSEDMLDLSVNGTENIELFVSDATNVVQVEDGEAGFVSARMLFHHLTDGQIAQASREGWRMLAPGGRMVVCEYVPPTSEAKAYERQIFDLKERGRQLWTGEELAGVLGEELRAGRVTVDYAVLQGYSVRDWLIKGGLPGEIVDQIVSLYGRMPLEYWGGLDVEEMSNGLGERDFLIDRPFVYVLIDKVGDDF